MIYIHIKQSVTLDPHRDIRLGDVAQAAGKVGDAGAVVLARLEDAPLLITAADIAAKLGREDIAFTGAGACLVSPGQKQDSPVLRRAKTAFVTALLFVGGAMSVLAYQTDTDMPETHRVISRVFAGSEEESLWVSLPYCLGVGAGVLFFANVLPGRKKKPTLFELEQFGETKQAEQYAADEAEKNK